MDISKKKTLILVLISIFWLACIILGTTGKFVLGMVVAVPLIGLHFLLGVAKKGIVSKKFLLYPILIWTALYIVAFILCGVYADKFAGMMPAFTVLGLHPSFAPVLLLYWIGGLLTLSLGFYLLQDEWLSQEDWEEFCQKAKKVKEGK